VNFGACASSWALLLGSALASSEAFATAPLRRTETSGAAVSIGVGSQYPLLGAQLAYYLQVPNSLFRVTPYAGMGALLCPECVGASFGVMGSWGCKHRIVVDAFYATVVSTWYSLHGEARHYSVVWGTGLAVGYEYMAFGGMFVRATAGASFAFGPPIFPWEDRIGPAASLGLGYKLQ
jgi:hypothetical protein